MNSLQNNAFKKKNIINNINIIFFFYCQLYKVT